MFYALVITFIACLFIGLSFSFIRFIIEFLFYLIISVFEGFGSSYSLARTIASIIIIIILLKLIFWYIVILGLRLYKS